MNEKNADLIDLKHSNVMDVSKQPKTLKDWLVSDSFKSKIDKVLPKHLTADRFVQVMLSTLLKSPNLERCTQASVFQALYTCSQLGIEPDGRRAHLIPYGDHCQLIIDYKGIVDLVRRSGDVSYIHADVVFENDDFEYIFGSGAFLKHKPSLGKRGNVICAYSFVKLKDGAEDFDVMNIEDVEAIRTRSKASNKGPWVTDWNEMAKKTVFRRHSKWLPFSPEIKQVIEADDQPIEEHKSQPMKPIFDDEPSFITTDPKVEGEK